jgi:hypothetical protein
MAVNNMYWTRLLQKLQDILSAFSGGTPAIDDNYDGIYSVFWKKLFEKLDLIIVAVGNGGGGGTGGGGVDQTARDAAAQAQQTADAHIADTQNPHGVTKTQVGLGNVNNTADADKPVSTAQQTAIASGDADTLNAAQIYAQQMLGVIGTYQYAITANKWTHVTATFDTSANAFTFNTVADDSSTMVPNEVLRIRTEYAGSVTALTVMYRNGVIYFKNTKFYTKGSTSDVCIYRRAGTAGIDTNALLYWYATQTNPIPNFTNAGANIGFTGNTNNVMFIIMSALE